MMLGPVSSENEGAGSGTGRVRAFSLVIRACWCWRGGVVSAARARGLCRGWPYLLQDVQVCLLEVVEGLEEASLDAGHVLLCEVGVVLGGGVWARPQQKSEVTHFNTLSRQGKGDSKDSMWAHPKGQGSACTKDLERS